MKELAMRLGVTKRTLSSWKLKAQNDCNSRSGRPTYTTSDHRNALIKVARELRKQGYPGSPAIASVIGQEVPLRLIRLYVGKIKKRRNLKKRELIQSMRITTKVKGANVIWSQDGTHIGRQQKKSIEAQIIKDRGSMKILSILSGSSANGKNVVEMMKRVKKIRPLPLVWMTDNGSCYINQEVKEFMKREKIIHLRSLPRTPQHNGAAERMMCELKVASMLGKNTIVNDKIASHEKLVSCAKLINQHRKRASFNFKSSNEIDDEMIQNGISLDRDQIYLEYLECMEKLDRERKGRDLRLGEREMVMSLLEKYGLVKRSRGGKDYVE